MQLQDKMIRNLNAQKAVTLDSGHLPMISKPKELSEILNNFVNEINQQLENKQDTTHKNKD